MASRKCWVDRCSLENEYIIRADEPFPSYHRQQNNLPMGLERFLTASDGSFQERPKFFKSMQRQLKLTSDPAPSHGARERASCCNAERHENKRDLETGRKPKSKWLECTIGLPTVAKIFI